MSLDQFVRDNGPEARAITALRALNTAAYAAVREALDAKSPNVDALKRIASDIDEMVDAA